MRACRGVTLLELLVSLVLTGLVAGCVVTLLLSLSARDAYAHGRAEELRHARAAADTLAAAVRTAREVRVEDGALRADGVVWRARDGVLERDGVAAVRGIATAQVTPCGDGAFRIAVAPVARVTDSARAVLVAVAAPRAEARR